MKNYCEQRGSAAKGVLGLIILVLIVGTVAYYTFGRVVPPGYIGIRQVYYGPSAGYSNHGLKPGLHLAIPFYSQVHLVPASVQLLQLGRDEGNSLSNVTLSDGSMVDVDVTVLYTIFAEPNTNTGDGEEPHGGPADLIKYLTLSPENWNQNIVNVVDKNIRAKIAYLASSSFYDPNERYRLTTEAGVEIRKQLAPLGVKLEDVLLRRYTYQSSAIENAIFQKNLQDQEVRLNEAHSKFSEANAQLEGIAAEWDAKITTLRIKGENEAKVLRSEAQLAESQLTSQGDLALAKAIAEVDKLKADALSGARGADVFVARKVAPFLKSLKGGVISGVDPYDLDAWTSKLGVSGRD